MKLHRFIGDFDLSQELIHLGSSEIAHQLTHVLRVKTGEEIVLCNGEGKEAQATVIGMAKGVLDVKRGKIFSSIPEPQHTVTLYAALLKGEHFEFIAQKVTEIGVTTIVPIITQRTIKLNFKWDRVVKIITEAAEQSGRGIVPTLTEAFTFRESIRLAQNHQNNLFFDFNSPQFSEKLIQGKKNIGCFIGPEGGWDEKEREMAVKNNFTLASLGNFTFRAETAALVASYLLCQ